MTNDTHPFLVSVWVTPKPPAQAPFDRPYWMEMARCQSEMRATEVADCLAIRNRLVQLSKLQASAVEGIWWAPVRHWPDEETVKRETGRWGA